PLLVNESVALVFEDTSSVPTLFQDEGKVSQILRNFISNALKFTERGEVRVSATVVDDDTAVAFSVADTGIGIAAEDQERIFHQFGQLENPLRRKVRGTGLGLPLTKKLVEILGGRLALVSEPGVGSTFTAVLPVRFPEPVAAPAEAAQLDVDPTRLPVLVLENSPEDLLVYQTLLRGSRYQVLHAATVKQARDLLRQVTPRAIFLDILLRGEDTWGFLAELKAGDARPVRLRGPRRAADRRADARHPRRDPDVEGARPRRPPPARRQGDGGPFQGLLLARDRVRSAGLCAQSRRLLTMDIARTVLLNVDDYGPGRYARTQVLQQAGFDVREATRGEEALQIAAVHKPAVVLLDVNLPDMSRFEVCRSIKTKHATSAIPVVP